MKKILGFVVIMAMALSLSSCGTQAAATGNTSAAYNAGSSIGSALKSMYVQYKADGKFDMQNANNLLSMATLASAYKTVKPNLKDKTIYSDLASGIIAGSKKSVTESTVNNVISTLGNMDMSSWLNQGGTTNNTANTTSKVSSAVSGLLNLLK